MTCKQRHLSTDIKVCLCKEYNQIQDGGIDAVTTHDKVMVNKRTCCKAHTIYSKQRNVNLHFIFLCLAP